MKKIYSILCFLFLSGSAYSDSTFVFHNDKNEVLAGQYLYILEDKTNQLSFDDVQKSSSFIKSTEDVPKLGSVSSTIWIKISIKNTSDLEHLIFELAAPLIDKVIFFNPNPHNNKYTETKIGQYIPFNERKYKHTNYLFDLNIPKGTLKICYLKINSYDPIEIPIKIATQIKSFESVTNQNLLFGMYIGLMLIMILYNLFIYLTIKDKSYLYYVLYIFSVALTQASFQGYTFKYLWPNNPIIETQAILLSSVLVGFASVEFLRTFLNTKNIFPKLDKIFFVAYFFYTLSIIVIMAGFYTQAWTLISIIVTPLSIYMLFVGIKISRLGHRPAKFFTIAWSVFLIGVFIHAFKDFGILPYNYVTKYTMIIGSAVETVLLSFALADRINILKKEKEESQSQTMKALQENERMAKEQNVVLEEKVNERTQELKESNKELSVTLRDLKEAQSHLVNAEKMASLGQLTAGVAHEINNPINFVTSSIKPLKRDINDLLNVLSKYENVNEKNITEKVKEINDLKSSIDIDYVKEEIDSLLKGIEDGASRTADIVKGLKTFSRIDETDIKRVDLNEGLDSTIILLHSMMNGKIKIIKEYNNIPKVECYAGKINQVFMNVLNNAIHAVLEKNSNTEEGVIHIKTSEDANNIIVRIKDNGTGIPDKIRNKIFDPFFTTKDVGEGTGLGLSIVYNIIESHKGKIEVETEMGIGTEFIITLPKLQVS